MMLYIDQTQRANVTDPLFGDNHLTLIRWILASAVAFGHSWSLTTGFDPFRIHDFTLSYLAVNGFFILSGLLIAKSLHHQASYKSYFVSRGLRIYPALIIAVLSFPLFFSPLFSADGGVHKIFLLENWQYVFGVLTLGDPEFAPGGIFANHLDPDFNGPLWTIRYELLAYCGAALLAYLGLSKRPTPVFCILLLVICGGLSLNLWPIELLPTGMASLFRLSACFLIGMLIWHWPKRAQLSWWAVGGAWVLFLLFGGTLFGELSANLMLVAMLMKFGLPQTANARCVKLPDYSYGIYIWHYPVMQAILSVQMDLNPMALLLISTPVYILLAGMSWHFIERPALKLKKKSSHSLKTPTEPAYEEGSAVQASVKAQLPH